MDNNSMNRAARSLNFHISLLQQLPSLIVVMDTKSQFIYSNDYTAKLFGYQKEENIIGLNAYDMRCPAVESAGCFIEQDAVVIQEGQTLTILDIHQYAYGDLKVLLSKKLPFMENDKIAGSICFCTEINSTYLTKICSMLIQLDKQYYPSHRKNDRSNILGSLPRNSKLSQREMECIFYLLRGKTSKEIAKKLMISPRTVEDIIERIKLKFKCSSRAEIIERGLAEGYLNYIPQTILSKDISEILY